MSNELTLGGTLYYQDSESADVSLSLTGLLASVTTKRYIKDKQNIGTSSTAINIGTLSALGWALFINRDTTNYVEIFTASGGKIFAKLLAGQFCLVPLGSDAQVPYARANTAACQVEFLIVST